MFKIIPNLRQIQSRYLLVVPAVALAVLAGWRAWQVASPPQLLANPGFEESGPAQWQVAGQGSGRSTGLEAGVLQLRLDGTPEWRWEGVGQRSRIEPGRPYRLVVRYRRPASVNTPPALLLRLAQFNPAGEQLAAEEITPEEPARTESGWRVFTYRFKAHPQAAQIEVGAGIYGRGAAAVDIDEITLAEDLTLPAVLGQDYLIWALAALLALGLGIRARRQLARLKPVGRAAAVVGANILIFFVFAELLALGIYFIRDGGLFYQNKKVYNLLEEEQETGQLSAKRIHPYFGYVDRPGWQHQEDDFWTGVEPDLKTTNNHGITSDRDYPFAKTGPNQYIIGIFGGSVAEQFAMLARDRLVSNLKQADFFAGKEIVVLNFAKEGYKQPQQLLELTYFLSIGQEFDMVINIDGFNEVAFAHRNYQRQVDLSMPHANIMDGLANLINQTTLTPEKLNSLARLNRDRTTLNKLAGAINNSRLASVSFVLEQVYSYVLNRYRQEQVNFYRLDSNPAGESMLFIKPDSQPMADPELFEKIARLWAGSSTLMSQLLAERGVAYFHFLQPNQYYSNKNFGPAEAERALEKTPYYATLVRLGYPALSGQFDTLAANNVWFYNAIPIFDNEPEMVYIDNCCHYNRLGNEILADFIAASILDSQAVPGR